MKNTSRIWKFSLVTLVIPLLLPIHGSTKDIEDFITQLSDSSASRHDVDVAIDKLSHLGGAAVEPLIAALQRAGADRCGPYADTLGQLAFNLTARNLANEPVEGFELLHPEQAASAKRRIMEALIGAMLHSNCAAAAEALCWFCEAVAVDSLLAAQKHSDPNVRLSAAQALDGLRCLGFAELNSRIISGRATLGITPPDRVDKLIHDLKHWRSSRRVAAAEELQKVNDPRTINPLIASLQDHDASVEYAAAWALAKQGDSRAFDPLVDALSRNPDGLGEAAATGLAKLAISDSRAIDALVRALDAGHFGRGAIPTALGTLGDRSAIKHLVRSLMSAPPDWKAQTAIAKALQQLRWSPGSELEQVFFLLGKNDYDGLISTWVTTRPVLLREIHSRGHALTAIYIFEKVGKVADLVSELYAAGNTDMAELFLNCGNKSLELAAKNWAKSNGYSIESSSASFRWNW